MNKLSMLPVPFTDIIAAPANRIPIPKNSILLNLSFKKTIPKNVTNSGLILARNETIAGFETVLMDKKKNNVPTISSTAIRTSATTELLDIVLSSFCLPIINIYETFHIIPKPNQ